MGGGPNDAVEARPRLSIRELFDILHTADNGLHLPTPGERKRGELGRGRERGRERGRVWRVRGRDREELGRGRERERANRKIMKRQ